MNDKGELTLKTPSIDQILNAVAFLEGDHPEVAELLRQLAGEQTEILTGSEAPGAAINTHPKGGSVTEHAHWASACGHVCLHASTESLSAAGDNGGAWAGCTGSLQ